MAVAKNKTRIQVTFGDEVLEKLDAFCNQTGMNRSSYITYIIAMSLENNTYYYKDDEEQQ